MSFLNLFLFEKVFEFFEIWDEETLSSLQERVIELSRELSERMGRASQWQTDLQRWFHQMGKVPVSEATKTFIDIALDDQERVFDDSFMEEFKDAHRAVCVLWFLCCWVISSMVKVGTLSFLKLNDLVE